MDKCFCGNIIPPNRRKHCSKQCVKRAWYLRNTNSKSYFLEDEGFWNTETGKGFWWERWASEKLGAKHLIFNSRGCDLEKDGTLIDVKVCELYKRKRKHGRPTKKIRGGWIFNRNMKKKCDFFYCICLLDDKLFKTYMIPSKHFPEKGVTIGWVSKYDKYLYD